jgi:hypothetical protein
VKTWHNTFPNIWQENYGNPIVIWFRYHITLWSWVLLKKLIVTQLFKDSATVYETRMFIIMFPRACHWSMPWIRLIQSILHNLIFVRSFSIYFVRLYLVLTSGIFLFDFPTKAFIFLFSHIHAVPCTYNTPWLDYSNYIKQIAQVLKLLFMQRSPVSCYFTALWLKYSPQHPVLKFPLSVFLSETNYIPLQNITLEFKLYLLYRTSNMFIYFLVSIL